MLNPGEQGGIDNADDSCDYLTGIEAIAKCDVDYCGYSHAGSCRQSGNGAVAFYQNGAGAEKTDARYN